VVALEQSKIMDSPFLESSANDLSVGLVNYDLCFQGMLLFLATVVAALFFFGRSIGLSVTSTTRTFHV
jgi:hypothetical protein